MVVITINYEGMIFTSYCILFQYNKDTCTTCNTNCLAILMYYAFTWVDPTMQFIPLEAGDIIAG